jgi:small subunit ribosomal protein S6
MRIYEELFILKPDTAEEAVDQIIDQVRQVITSQDGVVDKVDKWGIRKLAYRIQKLNEGFFILVQFTSGPETVKEIERRLRVSDFVLKFLTVRIDEKLKRIAKRKKKREKRASRKPAMQAPAPQAPIAIGEPVAPVALPGLPEAETEKG